MKNGINGQEAKWGAVLSLSLSVIGLITAELLPVSLLTDIASSLSVSESATGQAVSATAITGMISSLFIASLTRRHDRRVVMMVLSILFVISNLIVGFANNYAMLITGRIILGISLGGFWSMCAAVTMRLVPEKSIPKALSIIFGGASLAMALVAPLGTWLGNLLGWRDIFLGTAIIGCIAFVWQFLTLPSMASSSQSRLSTLFGLLARPQVSAGMFAMILVFGGHFIFFTYLRSFLEGSAGMNVNTISLVLLGFGISNVIGNSLSGRLIGRSLVMALALPPMCMAVLALMLNVMSHQMMIVSLLVALWGFAFGAVPVAWTTWLTRTVPDEAESGGGLQVASIQLAITLGAASGGMLFNLEGAAGILGGSGAVLILAAVMIFGILKPARQYA